jgi:hypothetical protein
LKFVKCCNINVIEYIVVSIKNGHCRETGYIGSRETGNIGSRETGNIGSRVTGNIGSRETGKIRSRETGNIGYTRRKNTTGGKDEPDIIFMRKS